MIKSIPENEFSPLPLSRLKEELDKLESEFINFEEVFKKCGHLF
jgi:hypothetical protein